MFTLYYLLFCGWGFSSALVTVGVVGLSLYTLDHERRIRRLESNQKVRNAVVDTTEELMSHFIKLKREHDVAGALLDNTQIKIAYLRHNGNPDASWNEIIKWHNEKFPTKPHGKK